MLALDVGLTLSFSLSGCYDISLFKGLVGSWLTPDLYQEGGAPGHKAMGRSHIYDSDITIQSIQTSCSCALPVNLDTGQCVNFSCRDGSAPTKVWTVFVGTDCIYSTGTDSA
jgi:hypothetical protein